MRNQLKRLVTAHARNYFIFPNRMAAFNLTTQSEHCNFLHAKLHVGIIPEKYQFKETKIIPGNILTMLGKNVIGCVWIYYNGSGIAITSDCKSGLRQISYVVLFVFSV